VIRDAPMLFEGSSGLYVLHPFAKTHDVRAHYENGGAQSSSERILSAKTPEPRVDELS
jgi:hypothetical protein